MSDARAELAAQLVRLVGGFAHNTIRRPGLTCSVCRRPIESPFWLCYQCHEHATSLVPIADRVGNVFYAVEGTQSYTIMRRYKANPPAALARQSVLTLLAMAVMFHTACPGRVAGMPVDCWASVPSTQNLTDEHPLHAWAANVAGSLAEVPLMATRGAKHERRIDPDLFAIRGQARPGRHVLLLDDSWVTGASAQSAACSLKQAGAEQVSVLTVARVIDPRFGPNPAFIKEQLGSQFDPNMCPWSGSECP